MSNLPVIAWRELKSYFFSPIAYIVFFVFYLVNGWYFGSLVTWYGEAARQGGQGIEFPMAPVFGIWFLIVMVIVAPILTMRLFAEERRSGTMEILMTAPVTDTEVTLGKYLAALLVYVVMLVPTVVYVLILKWLADRPPDVGPILGTYLGVVLMGMLFLAMGTFASSVTRNQIIAAVVGVLLTASMLAAVFLQGQFTPNTTGSQILNYFSVLEHVHQDFGRGLVDTRRLIFYLSGTAFFLFLTVRMVEARKWR